MYPLGNIVHAAALGAAIVLLRHIKCIHSLICSTVGEIYDSPPRQAEAQTEPGCASQAARLPAAMCVPNILSMCALIRRQGTTPTQTQSYMHRHYIFSPYLTLSLSLSPCSTPCCRLWWMPAKRSATASSLRIPKRTQPEIPARAYGNSSRLPTNAVHVSMPVP